MSELGLVSWMQPRDPHAAGRAVTGLCLVAVVVTVVFAPFSPGGHEISASTAWVGAGTLALTMLGCWSTRYFHRGRPWAWALCPVLAVAAIVALDLETHDTSVSAQIFFLFPTLYGASLLRPPGAVVVTACAVVGEVVVVAVGLPPTEALTDAGYVVAALVTTAVFLGRSGARQAELVARLERQAAIDPLTGLVTRRVLDEAALSALSGANNDDGTSLILVDVDRFKHINDSYGHPAGDEVLVQVAQILADRSRAQDVVCRMGGDEIALLLPGCDDDTALRRAESLLRAVRDHRFAVVGSEPVRLSVSIGLAHAPTHATDLEQLYFAADAALYAAKAAGRDRVCAVPDASAPTGPVDDVMAASG